MKRTFTFFIMLVIVCFSSCTKNETPVPAAFMTAILDGLPWVATATNVECLAGTFRIFGGDGTRGVGMIVPEPPAAGAFQFRGRDAFGAVMTVTLSTGPDFKSNNFDVNFSQASLLITEVNKANHTISGTFSGRVRHGDADGGDKIEIKDGKFGNLPYTEAVSTISAKINGTLFTPEAQTMLDESSGKVRTGLSGAYGNGGRYKFGFYISTEVETGTYILPNNYMSPTDVFCTVPVGSGPGTSGKFVITYHDRTLKRMKGTFEFAISITDTSVTEGVFEMYYR